MTVDGPLTMDRDQYFSSQFFTLKLSQIINYPLELMGMKLVRLSRLKKLQEYEIINITDIENDRQFIRLYDKVRDYTMAGIERCYALYKATKYILENNITGDFVECGVWRGGSCMLVAYLLAEAGNKDRKIWLYDTFAGMAEPGPEDGDTEKRQWKERTISGEKNSWCLAPIEEVEENMKRTGYPREKIELVKGKVEDSIPGTLPGVIALLRLDTDWYESTHHELVHLFPLLEKKGVLIIDDYGAWQGAKKASDEYFAAKGPVYLNRIDFTGRLLIK
jgi:O-methyltransferase